MYVCMDVVPVRVHICTRVHACSCICILYLHKKPLHLLPLNRNVLLFPKRQEGPGRRGQAGWLEAGTPDRLPAPEGERGPGSLLGQSS